VVNSPPSVEPHERVHTLRPFFLKIYFNINQASTPRSRKWYLPLSKLRISHLNHTCYTARPSHPPLSANTDNTWWWASQHFIHRRSRDPRQHRSLSHPEAVLFLQRERSTENGSRKQFFFLPLRQRQIKENEMGGTCSVHGLRREMRTTFWLESLMATDRSGDMGVERILLKWVTEKHGWRVWIRFI
jgi:hypothetical protein